MKVVNIIKTQIEKIKEKHNHKKEFNETLVRIINTKPSCLEKTQETTHIKKQFNSNINSNNLKSLNNIIVNEKMTKQELLEIVNNCKEYDIATISSSKKVQAYKLKKEALKVLEIKSSLKLKQLLEDYQYLTQTINLTSKENLLFVHEYVSYIKEDTKQELQIFDYSFIIREEYRKLYQECNKTLKYTGKFIDMHIEREEAKTIQKKYS